jgi:predicted aspartyl protease
VRIDGYFDDLGCPRVRIEAGTGQVFESVLNTAFSGELWMPKNLLRSLGFVSRGSVNVELPDGSVKPAELFAGNIIWFGHKTRVSAVDSGDESTCVGMGLLRNVSTRIDPEKGLVYLEAPFEGGALRMEES